MKPTLAHSSKESKTNYPNLLLTSKTKRTQAASKMTRKDEFHARKDEFHARKDDL